MLIDSHVHLQDPAFARDLGRVMARARDAGVSRMVVIGDRIASSRQAIALCGRFPFINAVVGLHPYHAAEHSAALMAELEALAGEPGVVAIGEIGLDTHYPGNDPELQRRSFLEQAALAARLGLPIVMHCRDAYDDQLALLEADSTLPRRGIIHCFGGTLEQARRFLALGFHIGVGATITYPKAEELRRTVEAIGLERIVSETDAPYLPPQSRRGRRNEPAFMLDAVDALARLTSTDWTSAARKLAANAVDALGLPPCAPSIVVESADDSRLTVDLPCAPTLPEALRSSVGRLQSVAFRVPAKLAPTEDIRLAVQAARDFVPEVSLSLNASPGMDIAAWRAFAEDHLRIQFRLTEPA